MAIVATPRIGNVFDVIGGAVSDAADAVADVASSIVDAISDAGHEIGAVLKFIAPIVALVPGWGTALSVALTAAAAYAEGDSIPDAILEIAGAAMPGPVARAAFDGGSTIVKTALDGGDVGAAAIAACRQTASAAGGKQAVQAFDVGLAVARGEPIGDSAYALARRQAQESGVAALAAFDAAVAVKNGGSATDAVLAAARAYIGEASGPAALVAFDVGVALAQGKALQDAGFGALKNFVAGNEAWQRAVGFAEKLIAARRSGKDVLAVLEDDLATDVGVYGVALAADTIVPLIDQWKPSFNDWGSFALAEYFGIPELLARAAQAIMRSGDPDVALFARLTKTGIQQAVDRIGLKAVASSAGFTTYTEQAAINRSDELTTALRSSAASQSYASAVATLAAEAPVASLGRSSVAVAPTVYLAASDPVASPAPVAAVEPHAPSLSPVASVAVGVAAAGACAALVWWARKK